MELMINQNTTCKIQIQSYPRELQNKQTEEWVLIMTRRTFFRLVLGRIVDL
jgi:hypothetical protein